MGGSKGQAGVCVHFCALQGQLIRAGSVCGSLR